LLDTLSRHDDEFQQITKKTVKTNEYSKEEIKEMFKKRINEVNQIRLPDEFN